MPGEKFKRVPIITELITGIHQTRKHMKGAFFDKEGTKEGIKRIEGYKKRFSRSDNRFIDQPDKSNGCSEGADALRQWAQAKELGMLDSKTSSYEEADATDLASLSEVTHARHTKTQAERSVSKNTLRSLKRSRTSHAGAPLLIKKWTMPMAISWMASCCANAGYWHTASD